MNEKTLLELFEENNYEEITNRFSKYLSRYKEIFNPRTSTGKVVSLARHSNDLNRTLRYLTHTGSSTEVHQMRTSIVEMFGEDELYQTIYLAFYETISRFNPDRNVPLEKFVYSYFPYMVTNEIIKLASPKQMLNDLTMIIPEELLDDCIPGQDIVLDGIDLDYKWIDGDCEEPFKCLTPLERKILVMIYCERYTHEEIAKEMKYHFSSIKRKKNDILVKLNKRINELTDYE